MAPDRVSSNFGSYSIANLDLVLWKSQGGKLMGLTGDAGIDVFGGGNVVSESDVDNVEHSIHTRFSLRVNIYWK